MLRCSAFRLGLWPAPGGLTIFLLNLLRFFVLSGDAETAFTGVFRIVGAVVFTHLGVSILKQGSNTVRSGRYYQVKSLGRKNIFGKTGKSFVGERVRACLRACVRARTSFTLLSHYSLV